MGIVCAFFAIIASYISKFNFVENVLEKVKVIFKILPILCTIIFLVLGVLFKPLSLDQINIITSNRVKLVSNAIEQYGITPFGTKIKWEGQKLPEEEEKNENEYNYIDSSYLNILFNCGFIVFIFIMYCLFKLIDLAYKRKDYLLILLIGIMEIYCFFDSWLLGIQFNTILFLLIEIIYPIKERKIIENE